MLGKSDAMSPKNSVVDSWNRLLVSAKCKAVQMLWNLSEQPTKMLAFCFPSKTTSYRTNGTTDVLCEGLLWRSSCRGWIWDGRCPWWWCLQCSSPQTANRSKQENRSYLEMNANDFPFWCYLIPSAFLVLEIEERTKSGGLRCHGHHK